MAEIIEMPKLSDTMTAGTLVAWLKKEGEAVAAGDMIAEVETDKATMEVENFEDGVILKLYVAEGDSVAIGDPICAVGEAGEAAPDAPASSSGGEAAKAEEPAPVAQAAEPAATLETSRDERVAPPAEAPPSAFDGPLKASPLAKKLADEKGVDLSAVQGTGPGGRIVKDDVMAAAARPQAKPAAAAPTKAAPVATVAVPTLADEELPVSNMRAAIARALVNSKQSAPHFYLQTEVDGAPLTAFRAQLNGALADLPPEQGGIKFSVNDLTLKAAAAAVTRIPAINRAWQGDTIKQFGTVHLAFGVAVDDGLVTPVIRDAQVKPLRILAAEAKELIGKARKKKLKPDEMTGSTLTVTNLGMFGITDFYGIINPPNAAILSIGATVKTPVVADDGSITVGYRMKVGLSGDHRVIDGAVGAQYLAALKEILETPALMLV